MTTEKYPLTNVSNIIHTEIVERDGVLCGTKVIGRHAFPPRTVGDGTTLMSGTRFCAKIERAGRKGTATVTVWSDTGWIEVASLDVFSLPIRSFAFVPLATLGDLLSYGPGFVPTPSGVYRIDGNQTPAVDVSARMAKKLGDTQQRNLDSEWRQAMEESLDILLRLGLDIVP